MWGFCSYLEAAGWTFAKKLLSTPPVFVLLAPPVLLKVCCTYILYV